MLKHFRVNEELLASTTLLSDIQGAAFPINGQPKVGVMVKWDSVTGTADSDFYLEVSNDGIEWAQLSTALSISGVSGSDAIVSSEAFFNYVRLAVERNSATGGTIEASISLFQ